MLNRSLLLACLAFAACQSAPTLDAPERPNVILIMVDDLGYQDLGCYGHRALSTPVLDGLAASGVRLTDFHSGATVCTPSRMALLTGSYPSRVGWTTGVMGFGMEMHEGLDTTVPTLGEYFQGAGYVTGLVGKWHLGNVPERRPHRRGFDSAYYVAMSNNQTDEVWRNDVVVMKPFENRRLTEHFTREAVRFVEGNADRRFFLYLSYTAPHFPLEAHPDWSGRSDFGVYGDVVEELDAGIGELVAALEAKGLREDTLIVFCSDNGPNPNEPANCLPYRGEKWSALEGGTRVPAIFSWPAGLPAGGVCDELVSAMDVLPTLTGACGIDWRDRPEGAPTVDGFDVLASLADRSAKHPREELLYWHGQDPEPQAIRVGDWKLFFDRRHALKGIGTRRRTQAQAESLKPLMKGLDMEQPAPPLLFHLADDPGELYDLSAKRPDIVEELSAKANEYTFEPRQVD